MPDVAVETAAIIRIVEVLPAPLGPRKPNASPRTYLDVDATDGLEVAEPLHQAAGQHQRLAGGRWPLLLGHGA